MDYNQYSFYRANPYADHGFMPPTAFTNRHSPEFMTEIPMGQQHLQKTGKKHFVNVSNKSNIQSQNILKSPQRYPFQNRIALDKKYQRNMNTIDIEGATSGSKISQGVRNKFRARQVLIRRQKQEGVQDVKYIDFLQVSEQKKKQIAYQQFLRNQEMTKSNLNKYSRPQKQQKLSNSIKSQFLNQNINPIINEETKQRKGQRYKQQQLEQLLQSRHRSIQVHRESFNPEHQGSKVVASRTKPANQFNSALSNPIVLNSYRSVPQINKYQQKQILSRTPALADRKQHRLFNPTNLSYQSSIYRVGRNLLAL